MALGHEVEVAAIGGVERKKIMLQEKFDAARSLVEQHNVVLGGEGSAGYVNPDQFINCIKLAGGTTEDRLKAMSYEDILHCLPTPANPAGGPPIKPVGLAKDIAKIFRGKEDSSTHEVRPVSAKKADKMTLRELVEAYDPEESENPVGKRLKDISRNEKFIVFANGRTVDVEATLKLLQELKQGYPGRDSYDLGGDIKEVHRVGDLPDNFVDENPLYRQRPLRPDGTCDQTNRSWNGVPIKVRQLIRVAMDAGALKDISFERVHDIMDMVMDVDAFAKLGKRYPSAVVEFKKLESVGKLPTLKLVLKVEKGAGGSKCPFDNAKKVEWISPPPDAQQRIATARMLKAQAKWQSGNKVNFNDADSYTAYYENWRKNEDK